MSGTNWARVGGICGILFAILVIVGLILIGDLPEGNASDAKVTDFYNDDGNLWRVIIGAYVWIVAGTLFLVFLASLYRTLRTTEGGGDILSLVSLTGGLMFTAMFLASALTLALLPAALKLGDNTTAPSADFGRIFPQLGFGLLLLSGAFPAALMMIATSVCTLRTGVLPKWTAWLGFLAAIAMFFAAVFFPMVGLPIWVLVISVCLFGKQPAAVVA